MDIQEMHIEFDLLAQEVNSEVLNDIQPEEKDILLNQEIKRFCNQRIAEHLSLSKKGFSDNTKRLDDLQPLVKTIALPIWYEQVTSNQDKRGTVLPYDYLHKIRMEAMVTPCLGSSPGFSQLTIKTKGFKIPAASSGYNFANFKVEIEDGNGWQTIFQSADYPWLAAGIESDYRYFIKDFIRGVIQNEILQPYQAYYEWVYSNYQESTIIFFDVTGQAINLRITDNTGINTTVFNSVQVNMDNVTGQSFNPIDIDFYSSEEIRERLNDPFTRPTTKHGIAEIQRNIIYLYLKDNMYCNTVDFTYLRQPKRVNRDMNISCDLSETVHHEIVDNAVTRFKALVASGEYRSVMAENLKQE